MLFYLRLKKMYVDDMEEGQGLLGREEKKICLC